MDRMIPKGEDLALRALAVALGYAAAGVHEEGANRGDQVEAFQSLLGGAPGQSWCAYFVCYCLDKAFAQLSGLPESRADLAHYVVPVSNHFLPLSGYCPTLWAGAKARGMTRPVGYSPQPGDIVLYDFHGQGEPHHVGIIQSATAGTVLTVEGNTSGNTQGSQADGDGVFTKVRGKAAVFGYITLRGK